MASTHIWHPHDVGFDPKSPECVPALRLYPYAVFLGGNRYQLGPGMIVDRLGTFRDADECPECNSTPTHDFKYYVRSAFPSNGMRPWEISFRPCRRCAI